MARPYALTLALLLVGGCDDEPPPPAAPPGPPAAASLDTVDLCADGDTAGLFRDHLRESGAAGVTAWLRQNVQLPANVRYCDRVAPPAVHTQAVRLTVYRIIGSGGPSGVLYEDGPSLTDLPLGMRTLSFDVFPEDGMGRDAEGVRIAFHYHGE